MSCHLCGGVVIGGACQYCKVGENPATKKHSDMVAGLALFGIPVGIHLNVNSTNPYLKSAGNIVAGAATGAVVAWMVISGGGK